MLRQLQAALESGVRWVVWAADIRICRFLLSFFLNADCIHTLGRCLFQSFTPSAGAHGHQCISVAGQSMDSLIMGDQNWRHNSQE